MGWKRSIVTVAILFAATSIGGLAACGGDDGGGGFDSSVSDDKKISELSQEERKTLCESSSDWTEKQISVSGLCLFGSHAAIVRQGTPASNQKARQACKDTKQQCEREIDSTGGDCEDVSGGSNCDATVGLAESCHNDRIAAVSDKISEVPACSTVEVSWYEGKEESWFEVEPDSCAELQGKCPEFTGTSR